MPTALRTGAKVVFTREMLKQFDIVVMVDSDTMFATPQNRARRPSCHGGRPGFPEFDHNVMAAITSLLAQAAFKQPGTVEDYRSMVLDGAQILDRPHICGRLDVRVFLLLQSPRWYS
ncbi:hypothetical protein L209DRAFT_746739 [Thermothelomyces heterothallicus CBS 203.75]